jgi:hypothetical protein
VTDPLRVMLAEARERLLGPRAARDAYVELVKEAVLALPPANEPAAAKVALGALRGSLAAHELDAIDIIAEVWAACRGVPRGREVLEAAVELSRRGEPAAALALAHAETTRAPSVPARYLCARLLEQLESPLPLEQVRAAYLGCLVGPLARPPTQADVRLGERSFVRWLELSGPLDSLACAVPACAVPACFRLPHALVQAVRRLGAGTKFGRARGLSELETVAAEASSSSPERRALAAWACRFAVAHADRRGDELSDVEAEQVRACLARLPSASERAVAAARAWVRFSRAKGAEREVLLEEWLERDAMRARDLDEVRRWRAGARFAREGCNPAFALFVAATRGDACAWATNLDAVLRAAVGEPLSTTAWAAAVEGVARGLPGASELIEALVRDGPVPPRGYVAIAEALSSPSPALLTRLLELALARGEEPARAPLAKRLAAEGWRRASAGETGPAIEALRASKRAAERAVGSTSEAPAPREPPVGGTTA